jgi:phosphoenolpyruvate synthase/pyruvate phosphate dikinase
MCPDAYAFRKEGYRAMPPFQGSCVRPLSTVQGRAWRSAGRKAARLARLAAAGFSVPDSYIVSLDCFDRHSNGKLTAAASHDLAALAARYATSKLAVRTSSSIEDGYASTRAGRLTTVLGVSGAAELEVAVLRCFEAAAQEFSEWPDERGAVRGTAAVLIQRQVEARCAGVAFTAHPITFDRSAVLIDAVRGLGDRATSGAANPDHWVVSGGLAARVGQCDGGEGAIDDEIAMAVARMARAIEKELGVPVDVE